MKYSDTKLRKMYCDTHSHIEYQDTPANNAKALAKVITIIIVIVLATLLFMSCTSQSGRIAQIPKEKVVILDSDYKVASDHGRQYVITNYKVKRIDYGVIDWITIQGKAKYESGDTIYHRFMP